MLRRYTSEGRLHPPETLYPKALQHKALKPNFMRRYTSEVLLHPPLRVISKVNDSTLFDHLDSTWEFQAGPTPRSCWVTFSTDFTFKSPLYGQLASVFFQEVRAGFSAQGASINPGPQPGH